MIPYVSESRFLGVKCIPGTDIHRLKVRIFEGSSPSVKAKAEEEPDSCRRQLQSTSASVSMSKRRPTTNTARSCLVSNLMGCDNDRDNDDSNDEEDRMIMGLDDESDNQDNYKDKLCDEKTPLERYIMKSEEKIDEQESVIRQLRDKIEDIETKLERAKSNPLDGNICRNCHLRLGHTSRNCELDKCSSVFKCGLEKNHPGELKLKEMRLQLKKHESKLKQLTEELRNRKHAVDNAKDKKHVRIESDLLQANRAAYMVNGNQNWSLLRKHVYLVQEYCKKYLGGKIPAKQDFGGILDKALTDDDSRNEQFYSRSKSSKRQKHENPARSSLERRGIEFLSSKFISSGSSSSDADDKNKGSQLLYTAPSSQQEEAEQLTIVVRESLHKAEPQTLVSANTHLPYSTPQLPYVQTGVHSPMAYGPYANMFTQMPSLPMVYPFTASAYSPMATTYPQMTTDIVAQQVCTTTTSSSSKPESTIIPSEDGSEDDAAATILLNLSSRRN